MRSQRLVDIAALAVSISLVLIVTAGTAGPVRAALSILFLTAVPGWAALRCWSSLDLRTRCSLAMPVSLALDALLATVLLWLHAWDPIAMFYGVAAVCVAALTVRLVRGRDDCHLSRQRLP